MDSVLRLRGGTREVGLAVMGGGVLCEHKNDEGAALHQRTDCISLQSLMNCISGAVCYWAIQGNKLSLRVYVCVCVCVCVY